MTTETLLAAFDRFAFSIPADQRAIMDNWLTELVEVHGFTDNQAKALVGMAAWMSVAVSGATEGVEE